MSDDPIQLLALDLEATLIDDAFSANPRPGLLRFLTYCDETFPRVALLTTVDEETAREVVDQLADNGHAPSSFANRVEYIDWQGEYKDLRCAQGVEWNNILFIDDDHGWVHPNQVSQHVPIAPWHGGPDEELRRLRSVLATMV